MISTNTNSVDKNSSQIDSPKTNSTGKIKTAATELFSVKYPIVQTGMGWVAYPPMVIAVAKAGGLGILATATMSFSEMTKAVDEIKQAVGELPFGVNLRTDMADVEERINHFIKEKVKVVSFAQAPDERMVKKLKDAGLVVMPTVGARRHAEKVAEWGVDAVIAQGAEGGGHTGQIPTSVLIPQVVDTVDIPVIAAGGFTDGRGLAAALAYGAAGIAMGTRFLLSAESQVTDDVKQIYFATGADGTVVTRAIDGAPQRVIANKFVRRLDRARLLAFPKAVRNALKFRALTDTTFGELLKTARQMKKSQKMKWSQIALAANAPLLTKAALIDGHPEVGILPTGVGLGVIDSAPPCEEIINSIMKEAAESLKSF